MVSDIGSLVQPEIGFDVGAWRHLLADVARHSGDNIQVICPFGFEVLRDRTFLTRNLHNFFIYLGAGTDNSEEQKDICQLFVKRLMSELEASYPTFFLDIYRVLTPYFANEYAQQGPNTLYIKCISCRGMLLDDYANYLISCIGGIVQRQIKAVIEYDRDPLSRRYLVQLCIIHNQLFGDITARLSKSSQDALFAVIRQLHSAELLGMSRTASEPTDAEWEVLHAIVLPYFADLYTAIRQLRSPDDRVVEMRSLDFHGYNWLTLEISRELRAEKVNYVISSYETFAS